MVRSRILAVLLAASITGAAAESSSGAGEPPSGYDPVLAASVGADEHGMRSYVLVILKTGPTRVPDGAKRDEMFRGHFANMKRLADEDKLVHAGPLDGVDGWRGLFIFATDDLEEARRMVATDPVIVEGEMVAEYHKHYGSAALMLLGDAYKRVAKDPM